jgi:hypothetical protein
MFVIDTNRLMESMFCIRQRPSANYKKSPVSFATSERLAGRARVTPITSIRHYKEEGLADG